LISRKVTLAIQRMIRPLMLKKKSSSLNSEELSIPKKIMREEIKE
jgi:hypothetical protein